MILLTEVLVSIVLIVLIPLLLVCWMTGGFDRDHG